MRVIEKNMCRAISNKKPFSSSNTSVTFSADNSQAFVYLHGNKIAVVDEENVQLFDGGWQSVTTKSRLNALLDQVGKMGEGIFQKNYSWFFRCSDGDVIDFRSGMLLT